MESEKHFISTAMIGVAPDLPMKDEYSIEYLHSKHKTTLMKYIKANDDFINDPEKFPEYFHMMCMDLNNIDIKRKQYEWVADCRFWINEVQQKYDSYIESKNLVDLSLEDKQLIRHLRNVKIFGDLTAIQLSCILDHLEIASDSPKLWVTICLELEALCCERKPENYWKKAFNKFVDQVVIRNNLLEKIVLIGLQTKTKSILLNALELRLLDFLQKNGNICFTEKANFNQNNCRICLNNNNGSMANIFEDNCSGMVISEKLKKCMDNLTIIKEDGFPQLICSSCLLQLENAYQFKILCEKSDKQLKSLDLELIKEETIEYINYGYSCEKEKKLETEMEVQKDNDTDQTIFEERLYDGDDSDNNDDNNSANENEFKGLEKIDDIVKDSVLSINEIKLEETRQLKPDHSSNSHQCETCGIICKSITTLNVHMKTHSNEKPHKCTDCGKTFKTMLSLKVHIRSHTGERPYVCETCGKAFKTCSAVNNHRAIHSSIKEFKCPNCPYRGSTKANLKIHERVHSGVQPYECRFCPIKFSTASNMHKHIRNIHQKQKKNKCEQCGRSFFSKESARKHMVTHSGLKPYSCTICCMAYGWYNGLQKHMKMQHPGVKMPTEKSFFVVDSD